ncbi:MAG: hypothetical protein S4CHLAM7_01200 [Chlamydiae bacterium]|nr:hypothetical protein [Chlamydiota bacterium]
MNTIQNQAQQETVLSHASAPESVENNLQVLSDKIIRRGNLPHVTVDEQLKILNELTTFELGRFLIQNRGLNGYWTDQILMHPLKKLETTLASTEKPLGTLEKFILDKAPTVLATQERFEIFRTEIQKRVQNGIILASVPCGLMSDLLTLDYSHANEKSLYGVDVDSQSLHQAAQLAKAYKLSDDTNFFEGDAWNFSLPSPVDVLTSNGLNIYEPDENRVVDLYRQFYHNIKPGGVLITSFLTPPPLSGLPTEWNMQSIDPADLRLQRVLFVDILSATWQAYTSTEQTTQQLKDAGFKNIEVIPGKSGMFPTVIAKRELVTSAEG